MPIIATTIINSISVNPLNAEILLRIILAPQKKKGPLRGGPFTSSRDLLAFSGRVTSEQCARSCRKTTSRCGCRPRTSTRPIHATLQTISQYSSSNRRRQHNGLTSDSRQTIVGVTSISHRNFTVCAINSKGLNIFRGGRSGCNLSSIRGDTCHTIVLIGLSHSLFMSTSQNQTFARLGANGVILISRQRNGGQNTNNRHDDHQFDEGETFLHCFHDFLLERVVKWIFGIRGGY